MGVLAVSAASLVLVQKSSVSNPHKPRAGTIVIESDHSTDRTSQFDTRAVLDSDTDEDTDDDTDTNTDADSCISSFPAQTGTYYPPLHLSKTVPYDNIKIRDEAKIFWKTTSVTGSSIGSSVIHASEVDQTATERASFSYYSDGQTSPKSFTPFFAKSFADTSFANTGFADTSLATAKQFPIETASAPDDTGINFKRENGTVPFGNQLGDVGQYYSQVAPSFQSSLLLENKSPLTHTVKIALYGDSGYLARLYRGCQLGPRSHHLWTVKGKQMSLTRGGDATPIDMVCEDNGLITQNEATIEPVLHGIYHAEIMLNDPAALNAVMVNIIDGDKRLVSTYPLVPKAEASHQAHAAGVVVTRQAQNWWDTELVVQNYENNSIQLKFTICNSAGICFDNNQARMKAKERRTFLASHLFYSDTNKNNNAVDHAGGLNDERGWHSVTATASAADQQSKSRIALTSHIFKQSLFKEKTGRPQAEKGSSCLLTSSHARGRQFGYSTRLDRPLLLRVYNPANQHSQIKLSLIDEDDNTIRTTIYNVAAYRSTEWSADRLRQQVGEKYDGREMRIEVESATDIAAFLWEDGAVLHPATSGETGSINTGFDNTGFDESGFEKNVVTGTEWFAPFWGAPTLPFQWDTVENSGTTSNTAASSADDRSIQMQSRFGLGETVGVHEQRPEWARKLNWYNWRALRDSCNMPVGDAHDYSTYMALWQGLERCSDDSDRSCINSEKRLQSIQNRVPSSCAGRPLFLTNEPDVNGGDFMSYAELGRVIYLFRDWPGDLYGPTFGGPQYDQAWYPSEPTPWCVQTVSEGGCPQTAGCEACVQDGVVDGLWDPYDINLKGLEDFFELPNLWIEGGRWPIEDVLDGMSIHFYTDYDSLANDDHWRAPLLRQYRDRADEAGWPLIVKEYGFITWPFRDGRFLEISRCDIVDRLDNVRRVLQNNLGGYSAEHIQNPFKLFWFHSGCNNPGLPFYEKLCLFETPTELSYPVGVRWYEDAVAQSDEDTSGICSEIRLPFIDSP